MASLTGQMAATTNKWNFRPGWGGEAGAAEIYLTMQRTMRDSCCNRESNENLNFAFSSSVIKLASAKLGEAFDGLGRRVLVMVRQDEIHENSWSCLHPFKIVGLGRILWAKTTGANTKATPLSLVPSCTRAM